MAVADESSAEGQGDFVAGGTAGLMAGAGSTSGICARCVAGMTGAAGAAGSVPTLATAEVVGGEAGKGAAVEIDSVAGDASVEPDLNRCLEAVAQPGSKLSNARQNAMRGSANGRTVLRFPAMLRCLYRGEGGEMRLAAGYAARPVYNRPAACAGCAGSWPRGVKHWMPAFMVDKI
jgi:hypothetical protein